MTVAHYLGIEGGATRTSGALVAEDLSVVARRGAGPANVHAVGEEQAREAVSEVVAGLVADAGVGWDSVAATALCLAGLRAASDRELWRGLAREIGIASPVHLTHDAAAALAAGSPDATGIVVVCGTGSMVFGRGADGSECFVGGRGPLLGDEGSGFDIGHQALRAAARSVDGVGESTELARLLPERLGLDGLDDLLSWVSPFAKDRVASLAPVVFEAVDGGDAVARAIVEGAAEALARGVAAVAGRLWPREEGSEGLERVVLSGGVLREQAGFRGAVAERVARRVPGARCVVPDVDGATGAARLARRWRGQEA